MVINFYLYLYERNLILHLFVDINNFYLKLECSCYSWVSQFLHSNIRCIDCLHYILYSKTNYSSWAFYSNNRSLYIPQAIHICWQNELGWVDFFFIIMHYGHEFKSMYTSYT